MTVGELKELLQDIPDDMDVLIPVNQEFDGTFYSPCIVDSGKSEMGIEEGSDETEDAFLLLPCGFGEEKDHNHLLN